MNVISIKDASVKRRKDYLLRVAGTLLKQGAQPDDVLDYLRNECGVQNPEVIVNNVLGRKKLPLLGEGELREIGGLNVVRTQVGLPPIPDVKDHQASGFAMFKDRIDQSNPDNITRALKLMQYHFGYDALACAEIVIDGEDAHVLDDPTINETWLRIHKEFGFLPKRELFEVVISNLAHENEYHPVRDYLDSLTWDNASRLDTWLIDYAGADDNEYVRAVGSITLMAAVRRVRQPGCKFDELPILFSDVQGPGKSEWLSRLPPKPEWFTDSLSLGDDPKKVIENTRGIWIAEISELQGTEREVERTKSFLSRQVDGPVRMAYARKPVRHPRQFICFGTTNVEKSLRDTTGNRRFWPIRVRVLTPLVDAERDQLWAEAAAREAQGASIRLPKHLWSEAAKVQEEHREKHPWEDEIEEKLDLTKDVVLADAVWRSVGLGEDASKRDNRAGRVIAATMKRFGYRAKKNIRITKSNGAVVKYCWVRDPDQAGVHESAVASKVDGVAVPF